MIPKNSFVHVTLDALIERRMILRSSNVPTLAVNRMSVPNTASLLQSVQAAFAAGNPRKAADLSRKVLRYEPRNADAVYFLGLAHALSGELEAAIARWRQVVQLNPRQFAALANLGTALWQRNEYPEAIAHLRTALVIDGSHAQMHYNLGCALQATGELEAAIASYSRALTLDEHFTDAAASLAQACYALGVAQHRAGKLQAALASYEHSLQLSPDRADAWRDRARALETLQRLREALASYERAVALDPMDAGSVAGTLSCSVRICDWQLVARSLQQLRKLPAGMEAVHPFLALSVVDDPAGQALIAAARSRIYASGPGSEPRDAISPPQPQRGERLRIAYVSSDLREHPVAHLIAGVLDHHDHAQFEIHAISLQGEAQVSETGQRLRRSVEHWHDVSTRTDSDVVQLMRELQIDIAVDLNGHTVGARPGIFAHRAAAVQVGYLGYAGTMGASYMDYVLADPVVIPPTEECWYTEKVIRLPHCYLPNDDQRAIGPAPTREQAGLPAQGMVFCAFTNAYKINPPVFDIWMRLLREVPQSVLWLRGMGPEARGNLLREAAARGVEAQRLVFAPHVASMADHLGRHQLADLYLDTLPYNAHSTACDALWVGVPVLTCTGRTFASRVAASALTAVGLPELITQDLQEYESRALQLAREPERLRELRLRLAQQRDRSPLFDTRAYCQHLENALCEIDAAAQA
jgi:protein O-GlcNAc transferase